MSYNSDGEWIETEHWGETQNASQRRGKDFFDRYLRGRSVIDIGCGLRPITEDAFRYDHDEEWGIDGTRDYDASFMKEVEDESFDVVYSSHTLEHCIVPYLAIRNWWRILKHNGFLIIAVPDRDLYELKTELPAVWNPDHKMFFLTEKEDLPYTINFDLFLKSCLTDKKYKIEYLKLCSDDIMETLPEGIYGVSLPDHPIPEYQIETVIRKL